MFFFLLLIFVTLGTVVFLTKFLFLFILKVFLYLFIFFISLLFLYIFFLSEKRINALKISDDFAVVPESCNNLVDFCSQLLGIIISELSFSFHNYQKFNRNFDEYTPLKLLLIKNLIFILLS